MSGKFLPFKYYGAKGIAMTEPQLREKMNELMATAVMQVKTGT